MVRPDYCAVDHLQAGVAAAAVVERFEQQLPQAGQRPAPELTVNRRPFAKMFVQIAPGNARPRNPENPIQNKAMIPRAPTAARTALDHEWLKTGPFLVAHQTPDQDGLPKRHLESDTAAFGNPLCQHFLVSTPSPVLSRRGLARDRHLTGFPEFEQFCIAGFPASTQSGLSPLRLPIPPRPQCQGGYRLSLACRQGCRRVGDTCHPVSGSFSGA